MTKLSLSRQYRNILTVWLSLIGREGRQRQGDWGMGIWGDGESGVKGIQGSADSVIGGFKDKWVG